MRSSCLRLGTRAVIGSRIRTFGSTARSEPAERRRQTVLSELFICQPSAWRFGIHGSLHDALGDSKAIRNNSNRLLDSDTQAPHICIVRLWPGSTFRASRSIPDWQLYGSGFRPWSSISASQNEDIVDGFQETASEKRNEVLDASVVRGGDSGVDLEVDCIEVRGDEPKLSVSEAEVPKLRIATETKESSGSAEDSEPISFREDNLKLLQTLGANEEQRKLIFERHPEFGEQPAPPFLMESVRLFQEFGMDAHVLVIVISKLNKCQRRNVFICTPPHKPKQILTFLRDKIGVKNMEKVVTKCPFLLTSLVETLSERVKTLESLGFVVDGALVENYNLLLLKSLISIRESAEALEMAGGPRCFLKHRFVLRVKGENITKRVANLKAILGEAMAREILGKFLNILLSREATVKELWVKLMELFPGTELMTRVQRNPNILGVNWKTFNTKLEYLASKGFTTDEMLTNFSTLTTRSLNLFIKPRVEVALRSYRKQKGCHDLSIIFCRSQATFEKRFPF